MRPIAERAIAAAGVADRVRAVDLDFFADPIPPADVVTMGLILHDWNLEKKMHLIRAAYDALPEGGAFIVVENLIDDARRENVFGLMMSLNMLIEFGDAFDYTGADLGWCREVGFRDIEIMPLAGPASAGIATSNRRRQPFPNGGALDSLAHTTWARSEATSDGDSDESGGCTRPVAGFARLH